MENCQVGVFLNYITAQGHALIDRELSLPEEWLNDRERCRQAGIPETVRFRTKGELAQCMIERARDAHLPIRWVVADTVYGHSRDLRTWLEEQQYPYVLAIPSNEVACVQAPEGCLLADVAAIEQQMLHEQDWQRLSMSQGTKGPRAFDWAVLPLLHRGEVDGRHWLLIRRSLSDPCEKAYYFVFAPPGTTLQAMVSAIGARWHIEEDFETAKDLGLDHYEVRSYVGWYRHSSEYTLNISVVPKGMSVIFGRMDVLWNRFYSEEHTRHACSPGICLPCRDLRARHQPSPCF